MFLALPILDAMLNSNGNAFAQGTPLPKRLGVWFWGNGVKNANWVPSTTGLNWTPKSEMVPLTPHKDYISVVSGTQVPYGNVSAHHVGRAGVLTGSWNPAPGGGPYGGSYLPSLDMIAAAAFAGRTRFRSLELAISRRGFGNSTAQSETSINGPNSYNPAEFSPRNLFDRLFGTGFNPPPTSGDPLSTVRRQLLVDVVRADANALKAKLGANDRIRLDQHLDGVAALESSLTTTTPSSCAAPARPADYPAVNGNEKLEENNRAMVDVLAVALACDMTRVFSYQFTGMQVNTFFWQTGAAEGLHDLTHNESQPQTQVHDTVVYTMTQFAYMLQKLKSMPEGAGNLLDNMAIYATSEMNDGYNHSYNDMPILVVGKAGGALRSGVHYRSTTGEMCSKAIFSVLSAVGVPVTSVGRAEMLVTSGITALHP